MELKDNKADDSENKLYKKRRQRTLILSLFLSVWLEGFCVNAVCTMSDKEWCTHLRRRVYRIQNISPWLRVIVDYSKELSYRPASLCSLAGWYNNPNNPMPESTISPSQGLRIWLCFSSSFFYKCTVSGLGVRSWEREKRLRHRVTTQESSVLPQRYNLLAAAFNDNVLHVVSFLLRIWYTLLDTECTLIAQIN